MLFRSADFTKIAAKDISIGQTIVGINPDGKLEETTITNKTLEKPPSQWYALRGSRYRAGRGSPFFSIIIDQKQKICTQTLNSYQQASQINAQSPLYVIHKNQEPTISQNSVIIGKLLGDGYLDKRVGEHTTSASLAFTHKISHEKYLLWTLNALGDLASSTIEFHEGGTTAEVFT